MGSAVGLKFFDLPPIFQTKLTNSPLTISTKIAFTLKAEIFKTKVINKQKKA